MGTADLEPLAAESVPAAFQRVVAKFPDKIALQSASGDVRLSWRELDERVRRVATGMAGLGIAKGDTVALMLPNTVECHLADFAAVHLGAVPFGIFNSAPTEQIEHQLRLSDTTLVLTTAAMSAKVLDAVRALGDQVRHVVVVDEPAVPGTISLADLENSADPAFDLDAVWRGLTAGDLATLIFTSGTTGAPKAAQWSHRTVLGQQRALDAALPLPRENVISFLPMAHAGGRVVAHYMSLAHGATITACHDPAELPATIARVHPDAFFSVPRFWEKIQVAIETMIANQPEETRRELEKAVALGLKRAEAADAGSSATAEQRAELDRACAGNAALLQPILERLGLDRIQCAFVGGAPSAPELSLFFRSVGVPMLEAYGLTEGSLNIFNLVDHFKCGTAGLPLPGVEVKTAEDGELLARSDFNFVNYRHQPEASAEALDADGWLHTGDIATIDDEGFVTIIDRKKEIIINAAGKNMSPAMIESAIKGESSLIAQAVAIGDRRRYVTALITLDPEALAQRSRALGLEGRPLGELAAHNEIRDEIAGAVERGNRRLNSNEQIKKFAVLADFWVPDSDVLTPTAKLKRRIIHDKYTTEIEEMYT